MIKNGAAWIAVFIAICITTVMDFTGYTTFSALPLLTITIIFWFVQRLSMKEIGCMAGSLKYYGYAILYPTFVLGISALIAYLFGDFSITDVDWIKHWKNILAGSTIGVFIVLLTEEGFFRGWLWGAFNKNWDKTRVLLITSIVFTLWHISAVTSGTEFGLPLAQVPVYLVNALFLGLIWGMLRLLSGSVIVVSVSHAIWNAFAYEFFGYGEKVGALGISKTYLFGPEVGFLGIVLNGVFFLFLWKLYMKNN